MKFNSLILFAVFSLFLFSCDDGIKFDNPLDERNRTSDSNDTEAETESDDDKTDTVSEYDNDKTDTESTNDEENQNRDDSDSGNTMPDDADSTDDSGDSVTDENTTDDDSSDSVSDDDSDSAPENDDDTDSEPDEDEDEPVVVSVTTKCSNIPENAVYNTVDEITQTWNGEEWYPSTTAVYNTNASTTECRFKCNTNYSWNSSNSTCVLTTQQGTCSAKPENTVWNDNGKNGKFDQTWNGATYTPKSYTSTYNETAGVCRFKCENEFSWINFECKQNKVCEDYDISGTPLKPNVYFLIDASGSMLQCDNKSCDDYPSYCQTVYNEYYAQNIDWVCKETTRWDALFTALDSKVGDLSTEFNVGMGIFPHNYHLQCQNNYSCHYVYDDFKSCIDLEENNTLSSFSTGNNCDIATHPRGGTPILAALNTVKNQQLYNFSPDQHSSERAKAVVVITDTDFSPNSGTDIIGNTLTATSSLAATGVKVYYMGFTSVNEEYMQQLAEAGGNSVWYSISDTNSISAGLDSIASILTNTSLLTANSSCEVEIHIDSADPEKIIAYQIRSNGIKIIDKNYWEYDKETSTLTIEEDFCSDFVKNMNSGILIRIPCETDDPNPCEGVENSTGVWMKYENSYVCGCERNYIWQDSQCVPDTRTTNCSSKPANTVWNDNGANGTYTQNWSTSSGWAPASYSSTYSTTFGTCKYICDNGYLWNGELCKKQISIGNICTGQTKCYDLREEIPCPASNKDFYGQDAQYVSQSKCMEQSFTADSEKGIVIDNNTGLIWEELLSSDNYTWDEAPNHCNDLNNSNYGGISNWRLPNPLELLTIVDYSRYNPAINSNFTEMLTLHNKYLSVWTSKELSWDTSYAYLFDMTSGSYSEYKKDQYRQRVLCVSGSEMQPATYANFTTQTINEKVVITDSVTGLMWQKWGTTETWQAALKYCEDLTYAGYSDWRLPNKNELASLANYLNDDNTYWSSTSLSVDLSGNSNDHVWIVDFYYEKIFLSAGTANHTVKCVRNAE